MNWVWPLLAWCAVISIGMAEMVFSNAIRPIHFGVFVVLIGFPIAIYLWKRNKDKTSEIKSWK